MTNLATVQLKVNGKTLQASVEPRTTLADCLRHDLKLTGTHIGCEHGVCGACTVIVDGAPVRSCLIFAVQADGADITTVEALRTATHSACCKRHSAGTTRCSVDSARPEYSPRRTFCSAKNQTPMPIASARCCLEIFAAAPAMFKLSRRCSTHGRLTKRREPRYDRRPQCLHRPWKSSGLRISDF
jgi:hypothetical protein